MTDDRAGRGGGGGGGEISAERKEVDGSGRRSQARVSFFWLARLPPWEPGFSVGNRVKKQIGQQRVPSR